MKLQCVGRAGLMLGCGSYVTVNAMAGQNSNWARTSAVRIEKIPAFAGLFCGTEMGTFSYLARPLHA